MNATSNSQSPQPPEQFQDPKADSWKVRLIQALGAAVGMAAAMGIGKLLNYHNFWLGLALVIGGTLLGFFLAQKLTAR